MGQLLYYIFVFNPPIHASTILEVNYVFSFVFSTAARLIMNLNRRKHEIPSILFHLENVPNEF